MRRKASPGAVTGDLKAFWIRKNRIETLYLIPEISESAHSIANSINRHYPLDRGTIDTARQKNL